MSTDTETSGIRPGTLRHIWLVMLAFLHMQTAEMGLQKGYVFAVSAVFVLLAFYVGAVTEREKQSGGETGEE